MPARNRRENDYETTTYEKKIMIQTFTHILQRALLVLPLLMQITACTDHPFVSDAAVNPVPEGYVRLTATVGLKDMTAVQTRAVDPDSKGVENIRLYCFDENGLFITTVSTTFTPDSFEPGTVHVLSGRFQADVPNYTHCVHIVANQSTDAFRNTDYLGQTEKAVMTGLTASSSVMVYWGRVAGGTIKDGTTGAEKEETLLEAFDRIMSRTDGPNYIELVRNQARVHFVPDPTGQDDTPYNFTPLGFYVCNTNAFGTIAPYNAATGAFDWVTGSGDHDYITLPPDPVRSSLPNDVYSIDSRPQQYVFETENPLSDPVSVIVRGYNDGETDVEAKYYRILIQDPETYETYLIKRNHSYDIHITGKLSPGYATFREALAGTPVNNVYFTISDDITSLTGADYTLKVDKTRHVLVRDEIPDGQYSISYTYSLNDEPADSEAGAPEAKDISVSWADNQNIAEASFDHQTRTNGTKIEGNITLTLLPMSGEAYREGTLLIRVGQLMRRVKVITVQRQSFVPTWVSSYVWPGNANEAFTLLFTIPDDTPPELFPFDVMVTAPEMDVRSETGLRLDVVTKVSDPERYGEDIYYYKDTHDDKDNEVTPAAGVKPIGYKFVVPVTAPGRQRIYFKTTSSKQTPDYVTIENPYFETMRLPFTFSKESEEKSIVFTSMNNYKGPNANHPDYEGINYVVVPRKINAPVAFNFKVVRYDGAEDRTGTDINIAEQDEFILFTTFLDRDETAIPIEERHFTFLDQAGTSSVSGRYWGFWPVADESTHHEHTIHMRTNRPNTESAVILRTNSRNAPSIKGQGDYQGNNYRSASFELANYRAFRFNASVTPQEISDGFQKEQSWTYEPKQQVEIAFDVTSFLSDSEYNLTSTEVDPFGTPFKVYIDAPMLEIDESHRGSIPKSKFYEESPGRFVYVVDADRSEEALYTSAWSGQTEYWKNTPLPTGLSSNPRERKILPFRTNSISSIGTITISAQSDIVDFDEETWTVTDKPITGTITFAETENAEGSPIPENAFISFERTRDNTRIGSLIIGKDGTYSLTLRSEYTFAWGGTEYIAFYYNHTANGVTSSYTNAKRMTLADLFAQKNVKLVKTNP